MSSVLGFSWRRFLLLAFAGFFIGFSIPASISFFMNKHLSANTESLEYSKPPDEYIQCYLGGELVYFGESISMFESIDDWAGVVFRDDNSGKFVRLFGDYSCIQVGW